MDDERFGKTEDCIRAFEQVRAEGIPNKHIALLQAHFESPNHTATWRQLAERVGYPGYQTVNLQYGTCWQDWPAPRPQYAARRLLDSCAR
jgi:hypothetical protein